MENTRKQKTRKLLAAVFAVVIFVLVAALFIGCGTAPDNSNNGGGGGDTNTPQVRSVTIKYNEQTVGNTLSINLSVGTIKLTAVVDKDEGAEGTLEFKSAAAAVATVTNDGTVTLVGAGEITITASYGDKNASFTLKVKAPDAPPEVNSVTVKYNNETVGSTLSVNLSLETIKLDAIVDKDEGAEGTLAFTSSTAAVATVTNDGTVTLVGAGETTITASYGDKNASFTLKVKAPDAPPEVNSVTIKYNNQTVDSTLSVNLSLETIKLDAIVDKDEGAEGTLAFTSSTAAVATVANDGTVTLVGAGETTITASYGDKSATTTLTVIDDVTPTTYTVTVTGGTANVTEAAAGSAVTLTPDAAPAHMTFDKWNTDYVGELEWTGDNTFKMPAGNVQLTAVYKDVLYTLKVVGATVAAAEKADGSAYTATGTDGGYDGSIHTAEHVVTEYGLPFGAKVTLKGEAPAGKMLVGWNVNEQDNRNNAEALTYTTTDTTSTIWAVYSEIIDKDLFSNITSFDTATYKYKDYSLITGGEDQYGYSGFAITIPMDISTETEYTECLRWPISFNTNADNPQAIKIIVKNKGNVDVTVELGVRNGGYFPLGWIKVPAGQTVYHNHFVPGENIPSGYWCLDVREFDGSADVPIEVVAAYAEAYPTLKVRSVTLKYNNETVPQTLSILKTSTVSSLKLEAEVVKDEGAESTLEFTSSNTDAATVDNNGNVTLVGGGSTVITATCGDKSAAFTLTVKLPEVRSISLSVDGNTLGDSYMVNLSAQSFKLVAVLDKDEEAPSEITYTSGNSAVATVAANGTVTLVGGGQTTLTASCGGKSVTVNLSVVDDTVATSYIITVTGGTADVVQASEGDTVTLTPNAAPAHTTFGGWTYTGYDGELTWTGDNTFTMPDSNVHLTAVFNDVLYTLKVVGATVASAKKADDSALTVTGTANGYDGDQTAEHAIIEYGVPFGAKVTLKGEAPAGKMLVGWDVNALANRKNDEALVYTMPDKTATVWAVYTTILSSNIFEKNGGMSGFNNYTKIDGTADGADPIFYGYSGFSIEVPAGVSVSATDLSECIASASDFHCWDDRFMTVKLILRNRGTKDITIEMGPKSSTKFCTSGLIKVPANTTVYHNYIAMEDIHEPWWFFNVREFDGSAAIELDVVAAYGDAFHNSRYNNGIYTVANDVTRAQMGVDGNGDAVLWGRTGDGIIFPTKDNTLGIVKSNEYEDNAGIKLPALYSTELTNLPAYDANDPYLTVCIKFINRSTTKHTYKYAFGLGTDENPWDSTNKTVTANTSTVEFTVSEYGETVLVALRVPRAAADQRFFISYIKMGYDTPDGLRPNADAPRYEMFFTFMLTYGTELGFDKYTDVGVGF